MSSQIRKYELKARAEKQAATRRRIVEATSALHEEVGPARTTVSEIARRAGVERLTVYTHFPNETELFDACGQHWMDRHPPPDPSASLAIDNPDERLRAVLGPLYRWDRMAKENYAWWTARIQRALGKENHGAMRRSAALAGLAAGLTFASKYTVAVIFAIVVLAIIMLPATRSLAHQPRRSVAVYS